MSTIVTGEVVCFIENKWFSLNGAGIQKLVKIFGFFFTVDIVWGTVAGGNLSPIRE
jgi:hypothetical protein